MTDLLPATPSAHPEAAAAPTTPSLTLEQISAEYVALEAEHDAVCRLSDDPDPAVRERADERIIAIHDRQRELADLTAAMPAHTPSQLRAKAHIVHCTITCSPDLSEHPESSDDTVTWSLVQDIMGLSGPGPDAERS